MQKLARNAKTIHTVENLRAAIGSWKHYDTHGGSLLKAIRRSVELHRDEANRMKNTASQPSASQAPETPVPDLTASPRITPLDYIFEPATPTTPISPVINRKRRQPLEEISVNRRSTQRKGTTVKSQLSSSQL